MISEHASNGNNIQGAVSWHGLIKLKVVCINAMPYNTGVLYLDCCGVFIPTST